MYSRGVGEVRGKTEFVESQRPFVLLETVRDSHIHKPLSLSLSLTLALCFIVQAPTYRGSIGTCGATLRFCTLGVDGNALPPDHSAAVPTPNFHVLG